MAHQLSNELNQGFWSGSMSFKEAQAYCILQSIAQTCHLVRAANNFK